jgi:hypothetical protein
MARDWLRVGLPQRFPDQACREQVIAEAQRWSQRVPEMSGLLAEVLERYTGDFGSVYLHGGLSLMEYLTPWLVVRHRSM